MKYYVVFTNGDRREIPNDLVNDLNTKMTLPGQEGAKTWQWQMKENQEVMWAFNLNNVCYIEGIEL